MLVNKKISEIFEKVVDKQDFMCYTLFINKEVTEMAEKEKTTQQVAEEFMAIWKKLTKEQQQQFYYMAKGIELMNEPKAG